MLDHHPGPAAPVTQGRILFLLGMLTGLALFGIARLLTPTEDEEDLALYRRVRGAVEQSFVKDVDRRDLVDEALRGAVGRLDPYSRYYAGEELTGFERETAGSYQGIGVIFLRPVAEGRVLFPMPGSPAERAGVRVGDRFVSVDGVPVADLDATGLQRALQVPSNGVVVAELEGRSGERRTARIEPAEVIDPTVRHVDLLDEDLGIGYLAIRSFSHETPGEFDAALTGLESRGMRALVLDLRGNPGGVLDSAVQVADRFLTTGVIVTTESRGGVEHEEAERAGDDRVDLPLVVLVDGDSASASEVLAGALQDHRVAVVAGAPTYGKGAVQSVLRMRDAGAVLKLTTAYYSTPAGRILERGLAGEDAPGIEPDLLVTLQGDARRRVHEHLATYNPPPVALAEIERWEEESGESLLARAPDDPQLDAALALLQGELPGASPSR